MYQTFPIALKCAETELEDIGQKKIARTFKKKLFDQASSMYIHLCPEGSVGHGNGTVCFLTVEGVFDIIYKLVAATVLRDRCENGQRYRRPDIGAKVALPLP